MYFHQGGIVKNMWATVVCVYAACFCSFSSAPATENTEVIMHKELLCVEVSETVETVHCNHFVLFAHAFFDLLLPFLFKHSYQPVSHCLLVKAMLVFWRTAQKCSWRATQMQTRSLIPHYVTTTLSFRKKDLTYWSVQPRSIAPFIVFTHQISPNLAPRATFWC